MSSYIIEKIETNPYFDLELIMRNSQETRIGGEMFERFTSLWEKWKGDLNVYTVDTGKVKYLVTWLAQSVEDSIDEAWSDSPSKAYADNALAQTLCMGAVHEILPEVESAGCAPAPRPSETLHAALAELGVPYKGEGPSLSHRFAVVTHFPFKGGCEICFLQKNCPKGQGQSEASSLVLPGFERE